MSDLDTPRAVAARRAGLDVSGRSADTRLLVIIVLITLLACAPVLFVVVSFGTSDEGIILHAADRMLKGQRLYTDFFEFLPPGSFMMTALWFTIFEPSVLSAHSLTLVILLGIVILTYLSCLRVSRSAPISASIVLAWVVTSQAFLTTQSPHHWQTTFCSMIAVWAGLTRATNGAPSASSAWAAGLSAGMAAMIIPTRGAVLLLALAIQFLTRLRNVGSLVALSLGTTVAPLCLSVYILYQDSWADAFYDVIIFPATRYMNVNSVPYGHSGSVFIVAPLVFFPALLVLSTIRCILGWRGALQDQTLRACLLMASAGFVGILTRPDAFHLSVVIPLACPALAYLLASWIPRWRTVNRAIAAGLSIALVAPTLLVWVFYYSIIWGSEMVPTARGLVVRSILPAGAPELLARIAETPADDGYLFYPYLPMLPFLTDRRHVAKYDLWTPHYTTSSQYHETCVSAFRHANWLVIDRTWNDPVAMRRVFPGIGDFSPHERVKMEDVLEKGFIFIARYRTFELRQRDANVNETVCAGIAN